MREIKFRAWDFAQQVMYDVEEMILENNRVSWVHESNKDGYCLTPTKIGNTNIEVMQYTGLKDRNGKEIYEGDILRVKTKCYYYSAHIGVVGYADWKGAFTVTEKDNTWSLLSDFGHNELEIIGNIYENPELLKEEK